jgi:hypothetical protein
MNDPPQIIRNNASCRILIIQKIFDFHYEVFESSIVMSEISIAVLEHVGSWLHKGLWN